MIAVILPTGKPENLSSLTDTTPESLLPIVNKPILEHQIELLAQHKVKDIFVLLKHKPDQVRDYFGCGERWGVKLSFVSMQKYDGALNALRQIQQQFIGPILCLQGNVLSNPDVDQLIKVHEYGRSDITLCLPNDLANSKYIGFLKDDLLEKFPFIMESELLRHKLKITINNIDHPDQNFIAPRISIFTCKPSVQYLYLDSPENYWEANRKVLNEDLDGVIIKGKEISKGVWVGAYCKIHPKAKLKAPLVIGDHCVINEDVVVEKGNVIGDHSIIEEGVLLARSIVWKGTYAGAQTEIKDSIVNKNLIFNIPRKIMLKVSESFLLGDSEPDFNFSKISNRKSSFLFTGNRLFVFPARLVDRIVIALNIFKAKMKLHKKAAEPNLLGSVCLSKQAKPKLGARL
jgi:mannose-1-phosphate guanylyltransferase/phosphomannomutase